MMRHVWSSAAAGVALLGAAALAQAQQVPDRGREPSTREKGPDGNTQRAPGAQQQPGSDQPGAMEPGRDKSKGAERPDKGMPKSTEQPDKTRPKGAERPDKDQPKGAERPDKDRPKGAERPDKDQPKGAERPDKDQPKGAERPDKDRPKAVEQPDRDRPKGAERPDKDRPKAVEQPDRDRPKGAERPDKDRPKAVEQPDRDRPKGAERPDKDRSKAAEQPGSAKGRVQLSEQQRGEVRTKLRETRVEKTRVKVDVRVGSRIPRSVRLHPLPSTIIALAPDYRGRSYFVRDDDTIVIVDAGTYEVVDVIPTETRTAGAGRAGLSLSPDQMRFIYARVPKDRSVDVRVRLGLGAEIPPDVELLPFPPEVLARVPEVEGYRYVVANREVAIVDPKDNSIALVINE